MDVFFWLAGGICIGLYIGNAKLRNGINAVVHKGIQNVKDNQKNKKGKE